MNLFDGIINCSEYLSVVGLGYVGMSIAVAFAKKAKVIGYDCNAQKVLMYRQGIDPTHEVGDEVIKATSVEFTADERRLREARFHIVAVPTPINGDHTPDLMPVKNASRTTASSLWTWTPSVIWMRLF